MAQTTRLVKPSALLTAQRRALIQAIQIRAPEETQERSVERSFVAVCDMKLVAELDLVGLLHV